MIVSARTHARPCSTLCNIRIHTHINGKFSHSFHTRCRATFKSTHLHYEKVPHACVCANALQQRRRHRHRAATALIMPLYMLSTVRMDWQFRSGSVRSGPFLVQYMASNGKLLNNNGRVRTRSANGIHHRRAEWGGGWGFGVRNHKCRAYNI